METSHNRYWKLARRSLSFRERTLIMGILNVTPDSFSDGGRYLNVDRAIAHCKVMLEEGADILDIGGESTRPGGVPVSEDEEMQRVLPIVVELSKSTDAVISVDTTKSGVARAAIAAGAEIINDISGLRFDPGIADVAAKSRAGLILMHSRGDKETLHNLPDVPDIIGEVKRSLTASIDLATLRGVQPESIAVDPGIGFGKSHNQNLELIARMASIADEFAEMPVVVGTSRKRFLARMLDDVPPDERLMGTMASVTAAVLNGAHIVRVHDVKAALQTVRVADEIRKTAKLYVR